MAGATISLTCVGLAAKSEPPAPLRFDLEIAESRNDTARANAQITLDDSGNASWLAGDRFPLSFGNDLRLSFERDPNRPESELDVRFRWMTTGPQDDARRFRVSLRALNAEGNPIFETWQTEGDNRIGPVEIQVGSRKGIRSTENSPTLRVPAWAVDKLRTITVELDSRTKHEMAHEAPSPSPINLRMTRPDLQGKFQLLFDNPEHGTPTAWALKPAEHQAVVTVRVPGEKAPVSRTIIDAREDGAYRVPMTLDPTKIDEASVHVIFWTRQPDHDAFVKRFFGEGNGGGYQGLWHQSGAPLIEVPYN